MSKEKLYKINYTNIENYYNGLDKTILHNLLQLYSNNSEFRYFMELTVKYNIYLFKKSKNRWLFKTENQIIKDCKMKKKTILRKHADKIVTISKSDMSDVDKDLEEANKMLYQNIKYLTTTYKLYKKLDKKNFFNDICNNNCYNDNTVTDLKNLNILHNIYDYSLIKNPKHSLNEHKYIAEYSN